MKTFKPFIIPITCLVIIDQLVKLIVAQQFMTYEFDMVGTLLRFRPIKNTDMSYGGNFITILSNPWILILFNIFVVFLFISGYFMYKQKQTTHTSIFVKIILVFGLAGSICSLIDKIFWGGSIDFIQIPNFFIFDLKDCYLTISEILFVVLAIRYNKDISVKEYLQFCFRKFR